MRWGIALLVLFSLVGARMAFAAALQPGDFVVSHPEATDGFGAVYVVSRASGQTTQVSSGGLFVDPTGVCVTEDGSIYVADQSAYPSRVGAIFKIDPNTGAQIVVTTGGYLSNPVRVMRASSTTLYVLDNGNVLVEVDRESGSQHLIASGDLLVDCVSMARCSDGRLFIVNRGASPFYEGYVSWVDPQTGQQGMVSSGNFLNQANDVTILPDGRVIVAAGWLSDGGEYHWPGLVQIDPITGAQTVVAVAPEYGTASMAIDFDGAIVFSGYAHDSTIFRCDPFSWTTAPLVAPGAGAYLAIVPEYPVPATPASWGYLKDRYRK